MSKTFTYTRQSGCSHYAEQTDEDFSDEESFSYEVASTELRGALSEIMLEHFINVLNVVKDEDLKKKVRNELINSLGEMISDNNLEDCLSEGREDELKDYFEQDVIDCWNNN